MAAKKAYVSFDYENDRRYKYLLEAWDANPNFQFVFADVSPSEIQSTDIARVKAAITVKVNSATHTLVIIGKEANKRHKDHREIGYRNWINFEIARSKANRNKLVAIKIDPSYESPEEIMGAGAKWAMSFTQASILKALGEA